MPRLPGCSTSTDANFVLLQQLPEPPLRASQDENQAYRRIKLRAEGCAGQECPHQFPGLRREAAAVTAPKSSSNGLYDLEVPRWGEVEANGNGSIKDVDRLLRTHKSIAQERDSWDEEYDRGKVKKVRNKEKQAGFEVNPFQAIANSCKQRLQDRWI